MRTLSLKKWFGIMKIFTRHKDNILDLNIPRYIAYKFYKGNITLTDIKNYPKLKEKIEEKNIDEKFRELYKRIGKEEFFKLDAEFIDASFINSRITFDSEGVLSSVFDEKSNIKTAEEVMDILYQYARKQFLNSKWIGYAQYDLGSKFIELNPDLFLREDTPDHVQRAYYGRYLSLAAFNENITYFEGKKVLHTFGDMYDDFDIVDLCGENIYNIFNENKELMNKIVNGNDEIRNFVKEYGIDYIIALDKETNGIFSHKISESELYISFFAIEERSMPEFKINKPLQYDEFKQRIYDILVHGRSILINRLLYHYDFVQGDFRREHPDLFLEGDVPEEVKDRFYRCDMSAEDVKKNPELIQLLQGKDLGKAFFMTMRAEKNEGMYNVVSTSVKVGKYLSEKLGDEGFLRICADYGKFLDLIYLIINDSESPEQIAKNIEEKVYDIIVAENVEYNEENLPVFFQEKYPELFITKDIRKELRDKFYRGSLTIKDINENPKLKEILLKRDIRVGFRRCYMGMGMCKFTAWDGLSDKERIEFLEKYGPYLVDTSISILKEGQSEEERELAIQQNIEENILLRELRYDENVPEFFRKKYPAMFLDDNAPENLKVAFYDNDTSNDFGR